jgi:hypothetical protein
MSRFPDLSTTNVVVLSGETILIASSAKAAATVIGKTSRKLSFMGMESNSLLDPKIGSNTTSEFPVGKHGRDELLLVQFFCENTRYGKDAGQQELVSTGALARFWNSRHWSGR